MERTEGRFAHGRPPGVVTTKDREVIRSGIRVANSAILVRKLAL